MFGIVQNREELIEWYGEEFWIENLEEKNLSEATIGDMRAVIIRRGKKEDYLTRREWLKALENNELEF